MSTRRISFRPRGVCSQQIDIEIENDIVAKVQFIGGCDGNLKAVAALVKGRPVSEVISLLANIECDDKGTSCADQLSKALQQAAKS